ncbi:hypothetical protein Tco_0241609 [Tanacetum coccineum]
MLALGSGNELGLIMRNSNSLRSVYANSFSFFASYVDEAACNLRLKSSDKESDIDPDALPSQLPVVSDLVLFAGQVLPAGRGLTSGPKISILDMIAFTFKMSVNSVELLAITVYPSLFTREHILVVGFEKLVVVDDKFVRVSFGAKNIAYQKEDIVGMTRKKLSFVTMV